LLQEIELRSREDIFLVNFAFKEKRIIITNDKDFGYLIYRQRLTTWGIILFRFIKESPSLKIKILEEILSKSGNKILNHFIVVNEDKVRIRKISK